MAENDPMPRCTLFALAPVALVAFPAAAQTAPEIVGDWHGVVAGSTGDTTIVLHVTRGADGTLVAGLENRDVAPGASAPVADLAVANGRLTFRVPAVRATYEGTWDEATQLWRGAMTTGRALPLNLAKGSPPAKPLVEGLDGRWEAAVEANDTRLRQVLRFSSGEWGTTALFDSPDQYVTNMPVGDLAREGRTVRFSLARGAARFEGTLSEDGKGLTGAFKTAGQPEQVLTFTRSQTAAEAAPNRPQNPAGPVPYTVEEVAFDNPAAPGIRLTGTLTLPPGQGPFPVAIMLSGSGQHDRDETLDGHKPFWVIADHLTRNGIAVLRFDDRGAGQSTGNRSTATPGDKASDGNAAFAYLLTRPHVRPDAVGFIGHSEGGLIGPIAIADNDRAAFLVSLAGPADAPLRTALGQLALLLPSEGVGPQGVPAFQAAFTAVFQAMAGTATPAAGRSAAAAALTPELKVAIGLPADGDGAALLDNWASPRVWYLAQYDSAATLSRIDTPVLALNGSLDVQVPPGQNLAAWREGLKGNPDVTVTELPGLNHMFQTATTGARGEYRDIEETFAPAALALISGWIRARFVEP
jgi:alpha-beta hydrolase superfamily lysophospholipase